MMEALSFESGALVRVHPPRALSIPGKRSRNLAVRRSLLALAGRKQTVVRNQLSPQKPPAPETSRAAPLVLAHKRSSSLP